MEKYTRKWCALNRFIVALGLCFTAVGSLQGKALKIAYSDWPGWVAWEIGIQKGWFKEAGVDVEFIWFEYVPSMDAFTAGQVDAVCMTNGDGIVTGATGKKGVGILINDYSNGNDMLVARPGIKSVKALKGKKIGVEIGFVGHLLVLKALESNGLSESDVELVNIPTDQTAQALASGDVDAICAWQPNSGQALKALPGSKALFTSADVPGLIYDLLFVSPESLSARREDWTKVTKVWFRIVDYIKSNKHTGEVLSIMSARVNLTPGDYAPFTNGTYMLDLAGNSKHFKVGDSLQSLYGSSVIVDRFNVENKVYAESENITAYFDPSIVTQIAGSAKAK